MNIFSKVSFKSKLILLCVFMASVSITIGGISFFGLQRVVGEYEQIHDVIIPELNRIKNMLVNFKDVRIQVRTLGLAGLTPEQRTSSKAEVEKAIKDFEKNLEEHDAMDITEDEKKMLNDIKVAWVDFKKIGLEIVEIGTSDRKDDSRNFGDLLSVQCPKYSDLVLKAIFVLSEYQNQESEALGKSAEAASKQTNMLVIFTIAVGVILGLGVGVIFARVVSNAILNVSSHLSENVNEVTSASTQIAASSQELSQAATEQAASLQETSSAVEELSSMVNKNTENAKNTAQSTAESQAKANEGQGVVERMISSMDEINQSNESIMDQINQSNQQMFEVVKVIQEIGNKTKVINDIVFQTKLLSFNASVEAARAGEHGKGFAVVAEEVGNLAQMSGNAAKEISAMLDGSIHKVESLVNETKTRVEQLSMTGKQKIENGVEVARRCGEILNEIVAGSSSVSNMASEISSASQEQAQGINEINKAMNQLDQVTQQNAAASGETASAAEKLSAQAVSLKGSVDDLMRLMLGSAQESESSHANVHRHQKSVKSKVIEMHTKPVKPAKKEVGKIESQSFKPEYKVASGEPTVPSRNDPGFSE